MNDPLPPSRRAVLVVDDDDQIRALLWRLLSAAGYPVLSARDGRQALALLREHGPGVGLALIDVLMPGTDGPAVLDALRRQRPELPACFITSYAGGYSREELLARGAAVLDKPFRLDALLSTVTRLLPPLGGAAGETG